MKTEELRELAERDLEEHLKRFQGELFKLRLQVVQGRITKVSDLSKTKRTIARIKTLLQEMKAKGGPSKETESEG